MTKRGTRYPGVRWQGKVLYFRITRANGRRAEIRYGPGRPKDAAKAREKRQEIEDRIRAGLAPNTVVEEPIADSMAKYVGQMLDRGNTAGHVRNTHCYLKEAVGKCGFTSITEISPRQVNGWISSDRRWSARSRNARRVAILAFVRWAVNHGIVGYDPLPSGLVVRYNESADRRRLSRALTPVEAKKLFDWLLESELSLGKYRRAFYLTVANTGLRWSEMPRLNWADFDLDNAVVRVPASVTKTSKSAVLPLVRQVVEALRELGGTTPFPTVPCLRTWVRDLRRAGLIGERGEGYRDSRGRQIDRKCLRMSFCTWLKEAGVDLRDAQKLMRHSSPDLTANTYTDIGLEDLRKAIKKLGGR